MTEKTSKSEVLIFSNYHDDCCPFEDAKEYCLERHLEDYPDDKNWSPSDEEVWEEILSDACHCYVDEVGNRPCDYGFPCSICEEKWVQELFESKLNEEGLK